MREILSSGYRPVVECRVAAETPELAIGASLPWEAALVNSRRVSFDLVADARISGRAVVGVVDATGLGFPRVDHDDPRFCVVGGEGVECCDHVAAGSDQRATAEPRSVPPAAPGTTAPSALVRTA